MDKKEIQKLIKEYIKKKIGAVIFYIIAIPLGIWSFEWMDYISVAVIRNLGKFFVGLPFALILVFSRLTLMVRLLIDIKTGYIVDTLIVTVGVEDTGMNDFDALKKDENRYKTIIVKDQNGRKTKVFIDRQFCKDPFHRGNWHTIQVLRYSKFLLCAQHGKKQDRGRLA